MNDNAMGSRRPIFMLGLDVARIMTQALIALGDPASPDDAADQLEVMGGFDDVVVRYCRQWMHNVAPEMWQHEVEQIEAWMDEETLPRALQDRSPAMIALLRYTERAGYQDVLGAELRRIAGLAPDYRDSLVAGIMPTLRRSDPHAPNPAALDQFLREGTEWPGLNDRPVAYPNSSEKHA